MMSIWRPAAILVLCLVPTLSNGAEPPAGLSADDFGVIEKSLHALQARIKELREQGQPVPDADIFAKGVVWGLRYESKLAAADVARIKKALERGHERAVALAAKKPTWLDRKGKLARGYISAVDGSTQPFGLIIPAKYDPAKPMRLDVVLHGSTRPVGLSELRFMTRFEQGDAPAPDVDYIELHPLGRVENCYRWAGEVDVFEAIDAVCRAYNVDRERIVLRGMSMGASGTWHLGLKHPDRFVALGPYCGYVDTYHFSQTPLKNFVKVDKLPPHQERALHMLDSIDYAANAGVVPAVACMGDKDVFFDAHVLMGKAMAKEGLTMVNLISPGTGHVIDPVTHKEQMCRIAEHAAKGLGRPAHVRFVTWTLKYPECHWLRITGLNEHYAKAEIDAKQGDDGLVEIAEPKNIRSFIISGTRTPRRVSAVRIAGKDVPLQKGRDTKVPLMFLKSGEGWEYAGYYWPGKTPGLQGPIDDAFTAPFLCVRGTGKPWNKDVHAWAAASLKRFAYEWHRYFRGELPIKDDRDVTDRDLRQYNLIMFGDPGSNAWIARALPKLPVHWTRDEVRFGAGRYPADRHVPVFIHPNPLPGAAGRYVVLNSGHTFHEKELASLNYLLFPRLGDWAVVKIGGKVPTQPSEPLEEEVLKAGFFDEEWKMRHE